jgi:hypothetical protein
MITGGTVPRLLKLAFISRRSIVTPLHDYGESAWDRPVGSILLHWYFFFHTDGYIHQYECWYEASQLFLAIYHSEAKKCAISRNVRYTSICME